MEIESYFGHAIDILVISLMLTLALFMLIINAIDMYQRIRYQYRQWRENKRYREL